MLSTIGFKIASAAVESFSFTYLLRPDRGARCCRRPGAFLFGAKHSDTPHGGQVRLHPAQRHRAAHHDGQYSGVTARRVWRE